MLVLLKKHLNYLKYNIFEYFNLFEQEVKEENNGKTARVSNFSSNSYIEYKSNGDMNKALSFEKYLNRLILYLKDIINNLKKSDIWKIQLTIANDFISSIYNDEERGMPLKCDNIEVIINDGADEFTKELFNSLKNRYQNNLESVKSTKFVFDYVQLL